MLIRREGEGYRGTSPDKGVSKQLEEYSTVPLLKMREGFTKLEPHFGLSHKQTRERSK
jgi:hypothetical protein